MSREYRPSAGRPNRSSSATAQTALAVDELLSTEAGRERLARFYAMAPAALRDQFEAATGDTQTWLSLEAKLLRGQVTEGLDDMPAWVRLDMLSTYAGWLSGQGRTCQHAPSPDRPQPVLAAAWRPELVTCRSCLHLIVLRPGSAANRTCDGCGRVTAGEVGGDGVRPGRVQYGLMLYAFGLCGDCSPIGATA